MANKTTEKQPTTKFRRHFFVCVSDQSHGGRGTCGTQGGVQIAERLEANLLAHPERLMDTAITRTECLGLCQQGPVLVVYPEGVWYTQVDDSAARAIASEHLAQGQPYQPKQFHWPTSDEDDDEGKIS